MPDNKWFPDPFAQERNKFLEWLRYMGILKGTTMLSSDYPPRQSSELYKYYVQWYQQGKPEVRPNPEYQTWLDTYGQLTQDAQTQLPSTQQGGGGQAQGEPNAPNIQEFGGYMFQWIANPEDPTQGMWDMIGPARDTGKMTEYQKSQVGFQEAQRQQEEVKNRQMQEYNQNQAAMQATATQGFNFNEMQRQWEQTTQIQNAQTYEEWRTKLLDELSGPSDWILRWQVANKENPFVVKGGGGYAGAGALGSEYGMSEAAATNTASRYMSNPSSSEFANLSGEAKQALGRVGVTAPQFPGAQSTTPPAPSWLQGFVPSQTAGQPISKQEVPTPSPQMWRTTPYSVQQGLVGYNTWSGNEPWVTTLQRMANMLPQEPTLGRRWAVPKQVA